jgi:hypothetical protein
MTGDGAREPKAGTSITSVARAFAPVHKGALGVAVAVVGGVAVFAVTAFHLVVRPGHAAFEVWLLDNYLPGYTVSWTGAFIGLVWGSVIGFVTGWSVAFVRNSVIALNLLTVRTKAELAQTRNLLDDI